MEDFCWNYHQASISYSLSNSNSNNNNDYKNISDSNHTYYNRSDSNNTYYNNSGEDEENSALMKSINLLRILIALLI